MNEFSEKWAEICFLLSENINQNLPERDFENQVVRAMEVLGWREFKSEIERQPAVQLGREGILRPDLVVYGNHRKPLIVVEVKRPIENITRDYVIGQLRSYMRQMKSDLGFLIGTELRIYYDGSLNPHSDPILLERIAFDKESKAGATFVETFNKTSLLENKHTEYLNNRLRLFNKKHQVDLLIQQLLSFDTKQKVIGYLRNEYPDIDDETFSEGLQQITIEISKKELPKQQEKPIVRKNNQSPKSIPPTTEETTFPARIASIQFDSHLQTRLRHIYGVLYFMKQGADFPSATHQTLKLFPEVQDYQTISDKCGRGFAGNVDTFISWFHSGQMLNKLVSKFNLSDHDSSIFKGLLSRSSDAQR